MYRKDFLFKACGLCIAVSALAHLDSCSKTDTVTLTLDLTNPINASLLTLGGSVIQNGIITINTANGYVALSLTCTHQGCTVNYLGLTQGFKCPCHGGTYNINGNVTGGPPPASLTKYTVTQNGNTLTIK